MGALVCPGRLPGGGDMGVVQMQVGEERLCMCSCVCTFTAGGDLPGGGKLSGFQSGAGVCGPGTSLGPLAGEGWGWRGALQDRPPGQGEGSAPGALPQHQSEGCDISVL